MESVGVRSLETTGVSIKGVTSLDDLVCLCEEKEILELVLKESGIESID